MKSETPKNILLVDDDILIAMSGKRFLEEYGYNVITAHAGGKAIEIVRENSAIDLILMDIDLGKGIDGTETAKAILKERTIPVVFLSSHTEPEIVEKTEKITSYGYVTKNSGITVLDTSIKMAFKLFEAHKKTKESEERLQRAEMISGFGSWEFNLTEKTVTASKGARVIYGIGQDDWTIADVQKIPLPEYRSMLDAALHGLVERDLPYDVVFEAARPSDGRIISIHSIAKYDTERNVVTGIIHDITEHKHAEEALRESEEKYRELVENINDVIYAIDNEGRFTYISTRVSALTGYLPSEICGRLFTGFIHNDDIPIAGRAFSEALGGKIPPVEIRIIRKNGDFLWVQLSGKTIGSEEQPEGLRGIISDITERKRAEEALRDSEENMRYIVKHDPNAIAVYDRDLHYIAVSDRYLLDYKVSEEDIIGKHHFEVFPEMPQKWKDVHRRCLAGAIERSEDDYFERPDGSITYNRWECRPWRRVNGEIGGIITYTEVTTERRKAEKILRESEKRFRDLTELLPQTVFEIDAMGNITYTNQKGLLLLGYTRQEFEAGISIADLFIPEDLETNINRFKDVLSGAETSPREYRVIRKNGEIVPVFIHAGVIVEDEIVKGVRGIAFDITDRKLAEEKIRSLLAEKELLLKEVHHRIKNNMSTIKSLLILHARSSADPSAAAALNDAGNRVQSMMVLYDKLYQSVDFKEISVLNYLPSLVDEIVVNFPGSALVKVEKKIDDFVLDVKKLQPLGIIVSELITNIMKYAFTGGGGLIAVSASLKDSVVTICIQDNGNGMPESIEMGNSTGFGLRLVGMLTEQLDGSIRIERGHGTRIILEFGK